MLLEQIALQQQRTQFQTDANTRAIAANSEEILAGFNETRRTLYDALADLAQVVNSLADLQQQSVAQLQQLADATDQNQQVNTSSHQSLIQTFIQDAESQRQANTQLFKQFATQLEALILEEREQKRLNTQ